MWTAVATALASLQAILVPPHVVERFQALEWRASDGIVHAYRLYVPEEAKRQVDEDGRRWPLLVWLHGDGERGGDNVLNLTSMHFVFNMPDEAPPLFILVPQHPADQSWFFSRDPLRGDFLTTTHQLVQRTIAEHPIDPDRVYVLGISSGGNACWELACRHPELFAAAVPMASAGGDLLQAARLKDVVVWAFHSSNDTAPMPDGARAMVEAVQQAGGVAHLTETAADPDKWAHDCWSAAFEEYDVVAWMLAQRRGAWLVQWRPGSRPFPWRQLLACAAVLGLIGLAVRGEHRRRLKPRPEVGSPNQGPSANDEILQERHSAKV